MLIGLFVFVYSIGFFSFFITSRAWLSVRGFLFNRAVALFTFNDESLGLLAFHDISFVLTGLIRSLFRLKTLASSSANSCLLTRVAPAVCTIPVMFLSAISRSISARLVFN